MLYTTTALPAESDLAAVFGSEDMISVASGHEQTVSVAPAAATVLSGNYLETRGARTLSEALQFVPGFNVTTQDGRDTVVTVRGITSRLLILFDGIPMPTTLLQPFQSLDNISLHNVERLEVIRGPGSSLYGADAVAGVVNLISKTASGPRALEVGAQGGSFRNHDGWLLAKTSWREADFGVYVDARSTDSTDAYIAADAQTTLDGRFHTHASLAPAAMPASRDIIDTRAEVAVGPLTLRASYFNQFHWHTGIGEAEALDPAGTYDSRTGDITALYHPAIWHDWELTALVDFSDVKQEAQGTLYPAGAFGGVFPVGVLSHFIQRDYRLRGEVTGLWRGWKHHTLRIGGGGIGNNYVSDLDARNFVVKGGRLVPTGIFASLGGVNDIISFPDVLQKDYYAYVQDEWLMFRDWTATLGVRTDHYSDFGSTTNPRVAMVWTATQALTWKLMYGRAFRPPSLFESYSQGIYTATGNAALTPTTLDTVETSIAYRGRSFDVSATVFGYREANLIQAVPNAAAIRGADYINLGEQRGYGAELQSRWTPMRGFGLEMFYALQQRHGHDTDNNGNIRFAPRHSATLTAVWNITADTSLALSESATVDRERPISDPRTVAADYYLLSATAKMNNLFGCADVSVGIRNLLNRDARVQSDSVTTIPGDIPLPGREFTATVRVHW